MKDHSGYLIVLFISVSHVLQAEKILIQQGIPHKIIPVPKKISSECGVCIRFLPEHREAFESTVKGKVEDYIIRSL
jgi:hypothetical protein